MIHKVEETWPGLEILETIADQKARITILYVLLVIPQRETLPS